MVNRDADRLRTGAERLFEAQNPHIMPSDSRARFEARGIQEQVIAEVPCRDATMLVVSIRWPPPGSRMIILSLREFIVGPDGARYPSKYGMTVDARVLPGLANAMATALEVLADAPRGGSR